MRRPWPNRAGMSQMQYIQGFYASCDGIDGVMIEHFDAFGSK